MAAAVQYRFSMLTRQSPNITDSRRLKSPSQSPAIVSFPQIQPLRFHHSNLSNFKLHISRAAGGGDGNNGLGRSGGGGGGGGGRGDDHSDFDSDSDSNSNSNDNSWQGLGILGHFSSGWRARVKADPQFPFKVLMEELVGVSACVLGDMASRPNFGLNELDFVFSTLVVGSILNFTLMYLLAPTASAYSSSLPAIFANCPQSHMFEAGSYTLMNRLGTFVYKGAVIAAVGFAAGLVGTAISNGLIKMRKKVDPSFGTPKKPPPTLLNALTWATHMVAPTASASSSSLSAIFANCLQSHIFEAGSYTLMNRLGTFVYKGAVFAVVGFAGGLVGTAISNGLIKMRKKMDPSFGTSNKPPPTLLNALTWAIHMGVSSNLRYQTLNGVEFVLAKGLPPLVFKSSVVVLRCINNILGGMSFVMLARMTGSQSVEEKPARVEIGGLYLEVILSSFRGLYLRGLYLSKV